MYTRSWKDIKYPSNRNELMNIELWLKSKQLDDGAEGLWRIHDDLYDLTSFVDKHPGGSMWLLLTKNSDVTEAFEAHHFTKSAENTLPKFFVRKAILPRHYPFTFHPNGFYRILKEKARKYFNYKMPPTSTTSKIFLDFYFFSSIFLCILAAELENIKLAILAGMFFAFVVTCGHNFVHMKDSWRTYYYYCVSFSVREWRISHCLSHHLFPNTLEDLEISLFEPVFEWLPKQNKKLIVRFGSWLYFPLVGMVLPFFQVGNRIRNGVFMKEDYLMFLPLYLMIIFGKSVIYSFFLWLLVISVCGFIFSVIGLTAAHHDTEIFHEGDKPREDRDWGLHQVDATRDRREIIGNKYVGLIVFGEHTLHHLFPTIDFCYLQQLLPIYYETLEEFGIELNVKPIANIFFNSFLQLARINPNLITRKQKQKDI
ncbi:hypothetical protein PGB90_003085 [Kerria lacca]